MKALVYIGNLPCTATVAQLHGLFSVYGRVRSALVVPTTKDGAAVCRGEVLMDRAEDAALAAGGLRGLHISGRPLVLNVARPQAEERSWDGRTGGLNGLYRTALDT